MSQKDLSKGENLLSGIAPPAELPSFLSNVATLAAPLPPLQPTNSPSGQPPSGLPPLGPPPLGPPPSGFPSGPPLITPPAPGNVSVITTTPSLPVSNTPPTISSDNASQSSAPSTHPVTSQPKTPGLAIDVTNVQEEEASGAANNVPKSGWVGWLKGTVSTVSTKVAQRAKTSMDTMITTLDPQMKEFLHSGGDLDLVVASDKEVKISPVREAFQEVFGKATVCGIAPPPNGELPNQPVGKVSALASAEYRINSVRSGGELGHPSLPVIAIENYIEEVSEECWCDVGLILLDDPHHDVLLQTYTQTTPIPSAWVEEAKQNTPSTYGPSASGLAMTIGSIASQKLQTEHGDWHSSYCGVRRRDMLYLAAKSLAAIYKEKLPTN